MKTRSRDPRSKEAKRAERQAVAEKTGKSIDEIAALEDALREVPMETFLKATFGPDHGAFYDARDDLWIVPDPKHRGPGFGFIAFRSDRSWFKGCIPEEVLQ